MSKRVRLTWVNQDKETIVEECLLLEEGDRTFIDSEDEGFVMELEMPMDVWANANLVAFEDDEGIFTLYPDMIKNIEVI